MGLPELECPFQIATPSAAPAAASAEKISISAVLAGQKLGIKEVDDGIWLISFMHYDLGHIDLEQSTLQTIDDPFGTRLSPMSQGLSVTHVSGPYNDLAGRSGRI